MHKNGRYIVIDWGGFLSLCSRTSVCQKVNYPYHQIVQAPDFIVNIVNTSASDRDDSYTVRAIFPVKGREERGDHPWHLTNEVFKYIRPAHLTELTIKDLYIYIRSGGAV